VALCTFRVIDAGGFGLEVGRSQSLVLASNELGVACSYSVYYCSSAISCVLIHIVVSHHFDILPSFKPRSFKGSHKLIACHRLGKVLQRRSMAPRLQSNLLQNGARETSRPAHSRQFRSDLFDDFPTYEV